MKVTSINKTKDKFNQTRRDLEIEACQPIVHILFILLSPVDVLLYGLSQGGEDVGLIVIDGRILVEIAFKLQISEAVLDTSFCYDNYYVDEAVTAKD